MLYTIEQVRKMANTKDIFKTKAGYIYKIVNGKKIYINAGLYKTLEYLTSNSVYPI